MFVSHTSELRKFPDGGSFIAAVEQAVSACGHEMVEMADFPAADMPAARLCRDLVRSCEVYVAVLGTRYGTPVRDMPQVSYTELEYDTAAEEGLPRLVFALDLDATATGIPLSLLIDPKYGHRQAEFRHRVQADVTTQSFADPASLGHLVARSLQDLATRRAAAWRAAGILLSKVTDPFALEVHRPVQPDDPQPGLAVLPGYLAREHDRQLAGVVRAAADGASGVAVLVGGSSTGKTRACWEALHLLRDSPGPWRLWHPIDPSRPGAALRELPAIGPRTVVWLNEAQFYLNAPDGGRGTGRRRAAAAAARPRPGPSAGAGHAVASVLARPDRPPRGRAG